MTEIPIRRLTEFCASEDIHHFVYFSDNQNSNGGSRYICFDIEFGAVKTFFNPNTVFLSGKAGRIKLEPVSNIVIDDECPAGRCMTIVCGPGSKCNSETCEEFRFIIN